MTWPRRKHFVPTRERRVRLVLAIGGWGLAGLFAAAMLWTCLTTFTWRRFPMIEYGVYTNAIWNGGHGELFRVLVNRNYLVTHLSLTLALLGPLFRVWDHPFLLSFVQWSMLLTGGAILANTMHRRRAPAEVIAAFAFFFVAYPLTQSVLIGGFHGVALYYLLVPWLHYCVTFRRGMAWLPLTLILGVREDAFVVVLPLFLYASVRERWRAGYVYAALSVAYGLVAMFVLFPWVSEMSLAARHAHAFRWQLSWAAVAQRAWAFAWAALPVLPWVRRRWAPVWLFPSLPLAVALASGFPPQYGMTLHYAAPIMACLATGMAESLSQEAAEGRWALRWEWRWLALPAYLVGLTLVGHVALGALPGGGRAAGVFHRPSPAGLRTLRMAARIPRDGVLLTPPELAGFTANRRDIITAREWREDRQSFDLVFGTVPLLAAGPSEPVLRLLKTGRLGVREFDGESFILQRRYAARDNPRLLAALKRAREGGR